MCARLVLQWAALYWKIQKIWQVVLIVGNKSFLKGFIKRRMLLFLPIFYFTIVLHAVPEGMQGPQRLKSLELRGQRNSSALQWIFAPYFAVEKKKLTQWVTQWFHFPKATETFPKIHCEKFVMYMMNVSNCHVNKYNIEYHHYTQQVEGQTDLINVHLTL